MTRQPEISEELKARCDHAAWLEDYGHWRSEHREALAMLVKVQAVILERDSALERQAAEIQSHKLELLDYDLMGTGMCSPNPEKQIALNAEFTRKHERAREMYEQTKKQHVNIVEEVKKLFTMCQSAK